MQETCPRAYAKWVTSFLQPEGAVVLKGLSVGEMVADWLCLVQVGVLCRLF